MKVEERAKWLHHAMHEIFEETFKSEAFNFFFVFIYPKVTGRIMEEPKRETSWKIKFRIFCEAATTCCTTEQHVANAGEQP